MKKTLLTLLICLTASFSFAQTVLIEGFEYANHDLESPVGWICDDHSWLCGFHEKDHNRIPHSGNWYAFTDADNSWMFMEMPMSSVLQYRFYFWGISDGEYDLEFWAGSGSSTDEMTTLLFTKTVNNGNYLRFSDYIETVAVDYQYIGIHAIAHEGAYHLTIDDIDIEIVGKYDMEVTPIRFDTVMMPNSRITIQYDVQNTGYEDLVIFMTPYTEYFSDIQFTAEGISQSSFPTVPNQMVHCTCSATLNPDVELGTYCFMDIMFTVSCDCVTRMATLWVTAGENTTQVIENNEITELFPNPTADYVNIKANGLQRVEVMDLTGKKLITTTVDQDNIRLNLTQLSAGIYFVTTVSEQGVSTKKLLKQ